MTAVTPSSPRQAPTSPTELDRCLGPRGDVSARAHGDPRGPGPGAERLPGRRDAQVADVIMCRWPIGYWDASYHRDAVHSGRRPRVVRAMRGDLWPWRYPADNDCCGGSGPVVVALALRQRHPACDAEPGPGSFGQVPAAEVDCSNDPRLDNRSRTQSMGPCRVAAEIVGRLWPDFRNT